MSEEQTVTYELEAPDFAKGPISMSGISLSSGLSGRIPTASPAGPLTDVLPAPPSAAREFDRGDTLEVFAEIYDNLGVIKHQHGDEDRGSGQ